MGKAPLTVTADNQSKTYGGADPSLTYTPSGTLFYGDGYSVISGVSLSTATGAAATAGTHAITASGGTAANYAITDVNGTLTINLATLTVTANAASETYNGLAYSGGNGASYSGLVGGDTSSVLGTLAYSGSSQGAVNVGSYTIVPGGLSDANYTISYVNGTLTINRAPLTIIATNESKTYGQKLTFSSYEFTSSGLVNGQEIGSVTLTSGGTGVTAGVGSYQISPSGATGGTFNPSDYSIAYAPGRLMVNPAPLTVTANNASETYSGLAYSGSNGATYSGLVAGDTSSVLGTLAYSGSSQGAVNAGSYRIIPGGLSDANYTISYVNGTLTINRAPLTIIAADEDKTYGQTLSFAGTEFSSSGLVNGESIGTVTLTSAGTVATAGVAGSPYTITPSAATGGTFNPSNYAIAYAPGTLTVNPAPLTVTANNASKTYDGLAYSGGNGAGYSGFVNGETSSVLGGTLGYTGNSQGATNAGSYSIIPGGLTSGNYAITFDAGALTVNPASLTITANDASKTYGTTLSFAGTEFTSSGLVSGQTIGLVTLTSAGTAADAGVAAGPYAIIPSAATGGTFDADNYAITYNPGSLAVIPAALTVTVNNVTQTYNGVAYSGGNGISYTGLVAGDTSSVLGGTLSYSGTSQGAINVGNYLITAGGLSDANYTISYENGTLAIVAAVSSFTVPEEGGVN